MAEVMVDSNVLLDIILQDPDWMGWSARMVVELGQSQTLVINPVIYSEISAAFPRIEDLDAALAASTVQYHAIPREAAFAAGRCFLHYRRRGGSKRSPLPDFFIGAHAAVAGMALVTRDVSRYRTYFPKLQLISPRQ